MPKLLHKLAHLFRKQRLAILIFLSMLAFAFALVRPFSANPYVSWWPPTDAIVSLATLGVALLVWWTENRQDWEAALPKRLTVIYTHDNHPAMLCHDATLIGESDMRPLAVQLGSQMLEGARDLRFQPTMELLPTRIEPVLGVLCKRYTLVISLLELPKLVHSFRQQEKRPNAALVWKRTTDGYQTEWDDGEAANALLKTPPRR